MGGRVMTEASGTDKHQPPEGVHVEIQSISALTLATHDMTPAVRFYRALGFALRYGGEDASFTSFSVGSSDRNLVGAAPDRAWSWWGRAIFYVSDVDAMYARAVAAGYT